MTISHSNSIRPFRHPAWRISLLILAVVGITIWAYPYFNESVFHVHGYKYKLAATDGATSLYHSNSGPPIHVQHRTDSIVKVVIDQAAYTITQQQSFPHTSYTVTDPEGRTAVVEERNGHFTTYENGDLLLSFTVYVGDERIIEEGDWLNHPKSIVRAAVPRYHEKQGSFPLFLISIAVLLYGWCGFRYKRVQDLLFYLTPSTWYAKDPEPSEFYYFMCKVGGILTMLVAAGILSQSL